MWRPSDVFRFVLTLSLVGACVYCLVAVQPVPEWLIGLTGMAVGNTFRLQAKSA